MTSPSLIYPNNHHRRKIIITTVSIIIVLGLVIFGALFLIKKNNNREAEFQAWYTAQHESRVRAELASFAKSLEGTKPMSAEEYQKLIIEELKKINASAGSGEPMSDAAVRAELESFGKSVDASMNAQRDAYFENK